MPDTMTPQAESLIGYHRRRLEELKEVRQPWESEWSDLGEYVEPTRIRLYSRKERPSSRRKIIDSTGTFAYNTLKNGMHSGLTSPARPWFKLSLADSDLKKFAPVKEYLAKVETEMRRVFRQSNVYNAFHQGYGDLGQFGQSCGLLIEDEEHTVRMIQLVHGRFWLARDHKGRATTCYRTFRWSVQRIVERFGWANVGQRIQDRYNSSKYGELFDVWHAVEPRAVRDPSKPDKKNKPWLSNYWLDEQSGNVLLEQSGFDENPIIAPAWELSDDDHYSLAPAMVALADIKMLQKEQVTKLKGIDKQVDPPMTGPISMKNNPSSLLPGSVTYVDDPTGKGYRPAMEVNISLGELREDINEVQERIKRTMYADLFFAITNMEGVQPRNQLELTQRKEEQLLQLGPVLENVYGGQLEPTIDRTFAIMHRRGELPPPPAELHGVKLEVEYTSMLAQAQQAVSTGAIERGVGFLGQLASAKPDVLDNLDADETAGLYFDMIGAPPSVLRDPEDVKKDRAARAQAQQQAAQAEMMSKVAPAVNQSAQAVQVLADARNNESGNGLLQQLGIGG
jgi:hypothetical protein